ncbi:MAG TPA: type I-U CRISPR-associated helicase/endonuclease Cas3 [Micromonosporaceae bacterium]|nr:type I-U CRISPR-associated helicase/endonuclease Cas3 [Micromonosporaceae bacterium]
MAEITAGGLGQGDFPAFVQSVHGHDPFPWQAALAAEVLDGGRWPDLVDVPTGLGKTSMMDLAVFVAAASAHHAGPERIGRRRCFFVVDRRIVVDEAYEHAARIAKKLAVAERDGDAGVLGRVAAGLRAYAPDARRGELLPVTRMRGGVTWSAAWLDRPDRPGIVLATVDQVGSRLLFRGYGVSDRRRPIDAALTGTDALLLVDEAHLSTALLSTLDAARQRDRLGLPLPGLSVVRLSATDAGATRPFVLDLDAHRDNAEAWRRLTAGKTLTIREATVKDCTGVLADAALQQLTTLAGQQSSDGPAPAVLVVCNTVDRARAVHERMRKQLSGPSAAVQADCDLLIGRSRPIDRPQLQDTVLRRFGVARDGGARPAVLVATQTVEVGVNLDADALVTESASWDALVQRLGRLNRLGRFARRFPGAGPAAAVVVHDGQKDGPVYGAARDATWQALRDHTTQAGGVLDVSPMACRALGEGPLSAPGLRRTPADVPVLLLPTLDAWVQTSPVPMLDPPVEPFLHGFGSGAAPVQMVWRDGLVSDEPLDDPFGDDDVEVPAADVEAVLADMPPRTAEMVEVPWHAVRQWMRGLAPDPVADLENEPDTDRRPTARPVREPFRVLARRPDRRGHGSADSGAELRWRWIDADQLRPSDLVIVPAERGGLDRYGWAPADRSPVRDVSEVATFAPSRSRRGGVLRLDSGLARRLDLPDGSRETVQQLITELLSDEDIRTGDGLQHVGGQLAAALPDQPSPSAGWPAQAWQRLRSWASSGRLRMVELIDSADGWTVDGAGPRTLGWLLTGPIPDPARGDPPILPERDDEEPAASSVSGGPVTLATHHAAVRRRSGQIAAALGLPDELRTVLEDAAGWHDLGKVEHRFQVMLHNGDAYEAALAAEPLAKSGLDPADRLAWRRAAHLSGLPAGARHEAWSAALVDEHLRRTGAYPGDQDLLIHLVAAHHGYARPLARLVLDPSPRPVTAVVDEGKVTVDSGHTVDLEQPARFARLNDRYGRWGLALLEAIVRCADMTVSEEGS